jgi:hypothetical protein
VIGCLRPAIVPKSLVDLQCINIKILPPRYFIASLMQLTVMAAAERHGKLIADLEAQGPGLRKAQMMRIGRLAPADQARL